MGFLGVPVVFLPVALFIEALEERLDGGVWLQIVQAVKTECRT
jgi:hypothetical protein